MNQSNKRTNPRSDAVLLPAHPFRNSDEGGVADTVIDSNRSDDSAEVTLVSVVGADETGKALVAHCKDAGVKARATVEIRRSATKPDVVHSLRRGLDRSNEEKDEESLPGTASYVAMLDGDGELVAAVADMRLLDVMTAVGGCLTCVGAYCVLQCPSFSFPEWSYARMLFLVRPRA